MLCFKSFFVVVLQDMFAVEAKHEPSELSLSVSCLDDLQLGNVIASDGHAAFFTADIRQHQPGILCTVLSFVAACIEVCARVHY